MTAPRPVPDSLTPEQRFDAALADLFPGLWPDVAEAIKDLADEYAAALIEQCARSPQSQQDPRQQNGAAS
jgi:hypothetical protein